MSALPSAARSELKSNIEVANALAFPLISPYQENSGLAKNQTPRALE
jgi:hypothetical protein